MTIRVPTAADKANLMELSAATGLFPPEDLASMGEMMDAFFSGASEPGHFWLGDDDGAEKGGIRCAAYCGPETFAAPGIWNLFFIGAYPDDQGQGRGSRLLQHIEAKLRADEGKLLLIETSSGDGFDLTRAFYIKHGYDEEARIRGFYGDEDKVIFRKDLTAVS